VPAHNSPKLPPASDPLSCRPPNRTILSGHVPLSTPRPLSFRLSRQSSCPLLYRSRLSSDLCASIYFRSTPVLSIFLERPLLNQNSKKQNTAHTTNFVSTRTLVIASIIPFSLTLFPKSHHFLFPIVSSIFLGPPPTSRTISFATMQDALSPPKKGRAIYVSSVHSSP
jgi:hypothetical protein